jgi:hypothetical protein
MTEVSNKVRYTFFGKVFPERTCVSISGLRAWITSEDNEISGELLLYISLSQVIAIFSCDKKVQNYFSLKNYVEDSIRVPLDAFGYTNACGYDIEITAMIDSDGNPPTIFGVGIPAIEKAAQDAGITFQKIMEIFNNVKGKHLKLCLADLREAIRWPENTGFFCYRAIESLRQYFVHENGVEDDRSSWEMLRAELDVDRSHIELIKKYADDPRHGKGVFISDTDRAKMFKLTWDMVNRFIAYANAGYKRPERQQKLDND